MKAGAALVIAVLAVLTSCQGNRPLVSPEPTASRHRTATDVTSPTAVSVSPSASVPPPAPSLSSSPETMVCRNSRSITRRQSLLLPGSLQGDVNGDGAGDLVRIAVDPHGAEGCRAFVVADLGAGAVAAAIPQWEPSPALPAPHLSALAQIDAGPGGEIVIDVVAGASTQFKGVYTYAGGTLVPLVIQGAPFDDLFPYGGSVGHLDGQACTRGGVVVSAAVIRGAAGVRYSVVRRFFRPADGGLIYEPSRSEHLLVRAGTLQKLPEFSGGSFASCPAA